MYYKVKFPDNKEVISSIEKLETLPKDKLHIVDVHGWSWAGDCSSYEDVYFKYPHKHFDNLPTDTYKLSRSFNNHMKMVKLGKFIDRLD